MCGDVLTAEEIEKLLTMMGSVPDSKPDTKKEPELPPDEYAEIKTMITRLARKLYELNRTVAQRNGRGLALVKDDYGNIKTWPAINAEFCQEEKDAYYFVAKSLLASFS